MKLYTSFERDKGEIAALNPDIVVEMWDFVKGSMSRRRKYHENFTEDERATISRYYNKYYGWTMRTGIPAEVKMKIETYNLLKRAGDFFATV